MKGSYCHLSGNGEGKKISVAAGRVHVSGKKFFLSLVQASCFIPRKSSVVTNLAFHFE